MKNFAKFIAFEGAEAVGKSTQIKLLSKAFHNASLPNIMTREPGGSSMAEKIRDLLLNNNFHKISELLLFFASRHENIEHIIKPNLQNNVTVFCDRFVLSSLVYQGIILNIPIENILHLHKVYNDNLFPHLTIIIDISTENCLLRLQDRQNNNKIDEKPKEFHEKIIQSFRNYGNIYPSDSIMINGNQDIYSLHKEIIKNINTYFNINIEPLEINKIDV